MSQQVKLTDATFSRLQRLAVPLVDDIESIINKLADFYELGQAAPTVSPVPAKVGQELREFDRASPPDLTHTKVLSIKIGGEQMLKPTWNKLLFETIKRAKGRLTNNHDVNRLIIVNFVPGKKEGEGYHFLPEVGASVQGQDANSAWRGACHAAQQLRIPVEVEFLWRNKPGAANPGITGRLTA